MAHDGMLLSVFQFSPPTTNGGMLGTFGDEGLVSNPGFILAVLRVVAQWEHLEQARLNLILLGPDRMVEIVQSG